MAAILFLLVVALCGHSNGFKFPSEVPKCKMGDSECIVKSANIMIKRFAEEGNRNINLLPLDPLSVPRIYIKQGAESPVNVELIFTNNIVRGIKDGEIYSIKGFDENIEGKYEIRYKLPKVELAGPYKISGKILVLPIQGEGKSNITAAKPDFLLRFNGKKVEKNGKFYLKPENAKLSFTTTRLYLKLDNTMAINCLATAQTHF